MGKGKKPVDSLDYDRLIQDALREVVRNALKAIADNGLPGNHHFYITFRTDRNDVVMPDYLRDQHPSEVTVVMQHQFWDLSIESKSFSVTLSFNGSHERLTIPYGALVSFMDPSVKFGLQFTPEDYAGPTPGTSKTPPISDGADADVNPAGTVGSDNIVTLDTFRKNKKK
ncbi:MAG: SspB family protein [Alphaproteobacteria bacterium]